MASVRVSYDQLYIAAVDEGGELVEAVFEVVVNEAPCQLPHASGLRLSL